MLGNACGFGDFTCRGAAVVLAGEQVAGGGEQTACVAHPAAGAIPGPRSRPRPAFWRESAGARLHSTQAAFDG